jgi:hypothetical protein
MIATREPHELLSEANAIRYQARVKKREVEYLASHFKPEHAGRKKAEAEFDDLKIRYFAAVQEFCEAACATQRAILVDAQAAAKALEPVISAAQKKRDDETEDPIKWSELDRELYDLRMKADSLGMQIATANGAIAYANDLNETAKRGW